MKIPCPDCGEPLENFAAVLTLHRIIQHPPQEDQNLSFSEPKEVWLDRGALKRTIPRVNDRPPRSVLVHGYANRRIFYD